MASVSQQIWSSIYNLYMTIALVIGGLVVAWCLYAMWRYRERPGTPRPIDAPRAGVITRERGHVLGAYVMAGGIAAIMFGLAFYTIDAVDVMEVAPEGGDRVEIDVTGFQFGWQFRYHGEYMNQTTGEMTAFNFTTVNDLRVPVDTPVVTHVTSRDVQHVFGIPEYRIQIYAMPGVVLPMWFQATEEGQIPIRCLRNCGVGHDDMIKAATLTVVSREAYDAFIQSKAPQQAAPPAENATEEPPAIARTALLEGGQIVLDESTLDAGSQVTLTVLNRASEPRIFGVGPADAPFTSVLVPAGAEGSLQFLAQGEGLVHVWARAPDAQTLEASHVFQVVS